MRSTALFVAALSAGVCVAKPFQNRAYAVKETHILPRDFTRVGDAPSNHLIRLQVGLKQGRFDELEQHLYESEFEPNSLSRVPTFAGHSAAPCTTMFLSANQV